MKKFIKLLIKYFKLEREATFYYAKLTEIKMRLFLSSNKSKEKHIQKKFKERVGYEIDFNKEPKTFNEKIQFRKLYDKNPLYSICADKYRVREYVKDKIGEEYLIPLLLVADKLTEEQWDKLPNQFVAKANHNSGPVQIVKDKSKANKKEIIKELNNQLKLDYGILSLENSYNNIPKKIIVEEFLEDNIKDYKLMCFNGKLKCSFVGLNRTSRGLNVDFYDYNWKSMPFERHYKNSGILTPKPYNYKKMIELAEILAKDFNFVRVDFYEVNNKIYFGELTFFPGAGYEEFIPVEWDYTLGSWMKLEEKIINRGK